MFDVDENGNAERQGEGGGGVPAIGDARSTVQGAVEHLTGQSLSSHLGQKLHGAATVDVLEREGDRETFVINVTDRERMRSPECLRHLLPHFGAILRQTFAKGEAAAPAPQDPERLLKDFSDSDICYTDRMIVVARGHAVEGFSLMKHGPAPAQGEMPTASLQLISVEAGKQYAGMGKYLYSRVLAQYPGTAISAATHTPAALSALSTVARERGFRLYFCGRRDGDPAAALTPAERAAIGRSEAEYRRMLTEDYGDFFKGIPQEGLPPHSINYGPDSIPWREEHRWRQGDHSNMAQTFNELRSWVEQHDRTKEGIYGMFTLVPESALGEAKGA